jgi:hypothetical protein
MGGIFQWPGAVHEGRGKCQPFVDERADAKQREALLKINVGPGHGAMATMFAVYFSDARKGLRPNLSQRSTSMSISTPVGGATPFQASSRLEASRSRIR